MLEQFRILNAALRFSEPFTIAALAEASGVALPSVQKTVRRRRDLFDEAGKLPASTGRPAKLFELRADAARVALQNAADAAPAPELPVASHGRSLGLELATDTLTQMFPQAAAAERGLLLGAAREQLELATEDLNDSAFRDLTSLSEHLKRVLDCQVWLQGISGGNSGSLAWSLAETAEELLSAERRAVRSGSQQRLEQVASEVLDAPRRCATLLARLAPIDRMTGPSGWVVDLPSSMLMLLDHPLWTTVVGDLADPANLALGASALTPAPVGPKPAQEAPALEVSEVDTKGFGGMKLIRRGPLSPALLLVGPPALADTYLRDAARTDDRTYTPVGVISLDRRDVGQKVRSVPILATAERLEDVLASLSRANRYPSAILFLDEPGRIRGLTAESLGRLKRTGVRLLRLPSIVELAMTTDRLSSMSMSDIRVDELMTWHQVDRDMHDIAGLVRGRRVLVTGAGGSIGSELCRQLAALHCAQLTLLDNSPTALVEVEWQLRQQLPQTSVEAVLCDVRDDRQTDRALLEARPDLVFHCAAIKYVSLNETQPTQALLTNVVGVANVADAVRRCRASAMVLVSSDKAVDPHSVLGATMRMAEAVVQGQPVRPNGPAYLAVRLGNILGSTGSVAKIFEAQIEAGGPVTVTHPDVSRHFVRLHDAGETILQALAALMNYRISETALMLMDAGEPVPIMELARQMIALSGRQDIEIEITGLRPGEKLFEALVDEKERTLPVAPGLLQVLADPAPQLSAEQLHVIRRVAEQADIQTVRATIFGAVAELRGESRPGGGPSVRANRAVA